MKENLNPNNSYYHSNSSLGDYYPFGMVMPERSFNGESYRYGFNGQEKDDDVSGNGNTNYAQYWEYDTRLGRRWNLDPIVKVFESPFSTFGNNPIKFIDPNGDNWYENKNYDPKNKDSKQYEWFEGNAEKDGYSNLGQFLVQVDKVQNIITIVHQNYEWTKKIDLNSDEGKKYKMLLAEGGFVADFSENIDKKLRGVSAQGGGGRRESFYGFLIISASIDNRKRVMGIAKNKVLRLSKDWGNGNTYKSLFKKSQYNGASGDAYVDFYNWMDVKLVEAGRTKFDTWTLLGDAAAAMDFAAPKLVQYFSMSKQDAYGIFGYAHNEAGAQFFNNRAIDFDQSQTLIQVVNTRTDVFLYPESQNPCQRCAREEDKANEPQN